MKKEHDAGVDDDGSVAVVSTAFNVLSGCFIDNFWLKRYPFHILCIEEW